MATHKTLLIAACILAVPLTACAAPDAPTVLRCEHQDDPLGIDTPTPRLSWQVNDDRRGAVQSAYQILVARSPETLAADEADVWDSDIVESDQSHLVEYRGPALRSTRAYYWKVRTFDVDGAASPYSAPARWEMGLLSPRDWRAQWIAAAPDDPEAEALPADWRHGNWIWHPTDRGDDSEVYLRRGFVLPADAKVGSARLRATADNSFTLYLNGELLGAGDDWGKAYDFDLAGMLRPGRNVLAALAANHGGPCGFRLGMRMELEGADPIWVVSDDTWRSHSEEEQGWEGTSFDDAGWESAQVLGAYGSAPWGTGGSSRGPLRSQLVREEFRLPATPLRARAFVCGLGAYQLWVNGRRISHDVLTPGWTQFHKRVQYQVYDLTDALGEGQNAIGMVLGNGWWHGRIGGEARQDGRESLRLIAQVQVILPDGTTRWVLSDPTWRFTDSPVLSDDIYDGEAYDARLQQPGWDRPGFDDSSWRLVTAVEQPVETLVAQAKETIQPIEDLPALQVTEPTPGVFVFDFGQNLTGRCRLRVRGEAGETVTLRHAEVLNPDGTIYTENLRSAGATDTYTLRGGEPEVWEPRFTYHGFRYAEVTGYPGTPTEEALTARMICSAAPQIGSFECSSELVNSIQHAILWGQRGNMYSVPTDCPQRDERLGWTGDTQMFANTSCCNLDMARFYSKWMADIRDCQDEQGAVRDVNPTNGGGPAAPAWGDACVIVPYWVWQHSGDTRIIEDNYDCMARWVRYMTDHSKNHLYERDGYGDWIAVVGSPKQPISAAYYYYDCVLMAQMASAIGREEDVAYYEELARSIKRAFNDKYLDRQNLTDPGATQTAYLLPLYFGLVPEGEMDAVVDNLVTDILNRQVHLSTGFLGTGYLSPVLTKHGHHDLAWLLAKQTTYPSWGYMVRRGATTIWELWNSDTAGPGMNSRNHFCLGAVGEWFYQSLAGINAASPGYKSILIQPRPVGDLSWVNCSLHSPYGEVTSNWSLTDEGLRMEVTVPANTSAEVHIPTFGKTATTTEGGRPATEVEGVTYRGNGGGFEVFGVGSGEYHFLATGVGLPPAHTYPIAPPPPKITKLADEFRGDAIDETKWQVMDLGLESTAPSDIEASVADGKLTIGGTTSIDYWTGKTLLSHGAFDIDHGESLTVRAIREALEARGTGARSSLWLWVDSSNYLMFSHDTEHGHWSYNLNGGTGPGMELLQDDDGGPHEMKLWHDGDSVHVFLDDRELADVKVPWFEGIRVGLTGQARADGDSVEAVFDDFEARLEG